MAKNKPSEQYLGQLRKRYQKASKKERGLILTEFKETTGYHRKYASAVLSGKRQVQKRVKAQTRVRARIYLAEDQRAVRWLAELFDQIGSRRLRAAMDVELDNLRAALKVSVACFKRLKHISPSTMDRLRRTDPRARIQHRGGTKPGTLLKSQIKVRTFADWNDKQPGFEEIDLVQHDGGNSSGFFACTLSVTDVSTGWTEMRAVRNKAQTHVFAALLRIRQLLPFPLLGLDSDNGAEFMNDELFRYCDQEHITLTRSRVGRKNDNAFVEQKNWSVIRRLVGYVRYDTQRQVDQLNALYAVYRLYVNHFLPVQKLISKTREGSKVKKVYDAPQTPYQRVLDSPTVSAQDKRNLRAVHKTLDLVELKQHLDQLADAIRPSRVG
jgi:hypothetical protein